MNKMHTPNFLVSTISSMIFCTILIIISTALIYKLDLICYGLLTYVCLLFTGMYSGASVSRSSENKKLVYALAQSTILFVLYILMCFAYKGQNSHYFAYVVAGLNIYLGAFLGCLLTVNFKKRKGFSK